MVMVIMVIIMVMMRICPLLVPLEFCFINAGCFSKRKSADTESRYQAWWSPNAGEIQKESRSRLNLIKPQRWYNSDRGLPRRRIFLPQFSLPKDLLTWALVWHTYFFFFFFSPFERLMRYFTFLSLHVHNNNNGLFWKSMPCGPKRWKIQAL